MEWQVEYTDEFDAWWGKLSEDEQVVIAASRHSNMKELRGKAGESVLRVLYAFDPRRTGILLIGGDKSGNDRWYEEFVPIADHLFDEHLRSLKKESRRKK